MITLIYANIVCVCTMYMVRIMGLNYHIRTCTCMYIVWYIGMYMYMCMYISKLVLMSVYRMLAIVWPCCV